MMGKIQLETMPRVKEMSDAQYQSMGSSQIALQPCIKDAI